MTNICLPIRNETIGVVLSEGWFTLAWLKKQGARQSKQKVLLLCQRPIHTHSTESLGQFISSQIAENIFQKGNIKLTRLPKWWLTTTHPSIASQHLHLQFEPPKGRLNLRLGPNWGALYLQQEGYVVNDWIWDTCKNKQQYSLVAVKKEWFYSFLHPLEQQGVVPFGFTLTMRHERTAEPWPYAGVWPRVQDCEHAIALAQQAAL